MPVFKPAYLIHGDDHGRIAERRARLRSLAERESGAHGVELLEGPQASAEVVAAILQAGTLALGRRFVIVDGVERWKEKEAGLVAPLLKGLGTETTVAFFAREDSKLKAPKALHDAVRKSGGDISAEVSVKPWELPKWVLARGRELELTLAPDAARVMIAHVGDRQQRLLRELEKLSLAFEPGTQVSAADLEDLIASSAERKVWSLADALVSGDRDAALRAYLGLRSQGERVSGLLYSIAQRLRLACQIAEAVEAGEAPAAIKRGLRMPVKAADRLIEDARARGSDDLRRAIEQIADLELASRGGGPGGAGEDTEAVLAIGRPMA